MEKMYRIYYGNKKEDYIRRYLKEEDIIDGRLTEAKAFNLFYEDMIICNSYLQNNFDNLVTLVSGYNENEEYYDEEYQVFIVNPTFGEEITTKATEKMGNTLYYDNNLELYITGITDLGTSRDYVPTQIKVKEEK